MQTLHISRQELHTRAASWTGCWTACSTPPFWWTPTAASSTSAPAPSPTRLSGQRWWGSISQCWTSSPPSRRCCAPANPARSLSGAPWPALYLQPVSRPGRGAGHRRGGHHHGAQPGPVEKGALPAQRPGRRLPGPLPGSGPGGQRLPPGGFCRGEPPGGRPAGQGPEAAHSGERTHSGGDRHRQGDHRQRHPCRAPRGATAPSPM